MSKLWPSTGLIGGAFGDLDAIDGALLNEGDGAIVIDPTTSIYYHYTLDATSGAAESSPDIIAPDDNPGDKRWILIPGPARNLNYVSFSTTPTGVPTTEGVLAWDSLTHLPFVKSDIPGASLNVGLEDWTRVRNNTGLPMDDGSSVMYAGAYDPYTFNVVPAAATPGLVMAGVITHDIAPGAFGWVVTRGIIHDIDTTGFGADKLLYLSVTPGELTINPPSPPNYTIPIGFTMNDAVDGNIYIYASHPASIIAATDAAVASGDPTGFHDGINIDVSYDPITRKITLTGDLKYSWKGQVKELTSPWVSDAHDAALDVGYFLSSVDGENFTWSTTPWAFDVIQAAFVWHGTTDKYALRETHGLMPWQAHQEFHQTTGTYRTAGGDISGIVLDSTTAAERRPDVAAMTIKDEDITTINSLLNSSLYTQAFLTGSGLIDFLPDETDIVPLNGAIPYFNEFNSPNWVQTPLSQNQYMSVWLVGLPVSSDSDSQKYRYIWLQGQTAGTFAGQQALFPEDLSLGDFTDLFTEFVFSAKVILRFQAGNWFVSEVQNLSGTRARTTGSPSGVYLSTVTHDDTMTGEGTVADPLAVDKVVVNAEDVFDNGIKGVDTIIDWSNGAVQSIQYSAIINLSFTGWEHLAPLADGKAQSGTLIGIDGDLFAPTFDDVNQGPLPTYTAGFANVQEIASLGPDGAIYNMWQVSNDQHVLLGVDGIVNGDFVNWTGDNPDNWAVSFEDANNQVTEVVDGARLLSDGTSPVQFSQAGSLINGATYIATIRKSNHVSGLLRMVQGFSTVVIPNTDANGTYTVIYTSDGVNLGFVRPVGGCDYVFELVENKRLF